MKHILIAAAIGAVSMSLQAQQQQPPRFGENVDVNLVLIDAVVTDSKGNQILGLDKNDFVVKEDGVVQQIDSVEYYTNLQLLTGREENAPFKVEKSHEQRYFVLFFDKPSDSALWSEVSRARRAARDFVKSRMRPGDLVAIAGHDVRLKIYSDFTSDKQQLDRALEDAAKFGLGVTSGDGPLLTALNKSTMIDKTGTVYEALEALGDGLKTIRGRKNLVVFSAGIYEPGQTVRDGLIVSQSRYYEPMIQALNDANVTVNAINLLGASTDLGQDIPALHQTLEQLTHDTGGDYYRHSVSFEQPLRKIEQHNSGYYLISYYAHHPKGTSGFQNVDVSLKPRGLRLRARPGYSFGG